MALVEPPSTAHPRKASLWRVNLQADLRAAGPSPRATGTAPLGTPPAVGRTRNNYPKYTDKNERPPGNSARPGHLQLHHFNRHPPLGTLHIYGDPPQTRGIQVQFCVVSVRVVQRVESGAFPHVAGFIMLG